MTADPALPAACAGAPRDLGLDQAAVFGDELRAWARGARARVPAALPRDVRRHFPQLAERLDGVARGAGVDGAALFAALDAPLGPPVAAQPLVFGVRAPAQGGDAPVLAWAALAPGVPFRLRRSRPENGLASLELVTPWLVGALAGVNEAGLAVACAPHEAPLNTEKCRAPALLLVQECLQRFQGVEGAAEWCRHRPAGGRATILFADASGRLSGARVTPGVREDLVPDGGLLAGGLPRERLASAVTGPFADRDAALAAIVETARSALAVGAGSRRDVVALAVDTTGRRLSVAAGGEPPRTTV